MRPALAAAGALGGLGLGLAGATHVWARHVEIHRYTRARPSRGSCRRARARDVCRTSATSTSSPDQHRKLAFLEHLESLRPHLVIDTGDNIASAAAVPALAQAIEPLLRRPGAFVMGSNDMFAPMPKNPARYLSPDPRPAGLTEPREPTRPPRSSPHASRSTAGRT
ncbi:hypothetical protein [Brachybacterium sp. GPGPB12]|uniref:hypothetical protein n=1 Tax=Brachybacterium sp. GPGPB12 TaxID=3023517 RepID=UPI0031345B28